MFHTATFEPSTVRNRDKLSNAIVIRVILTGVDVKGLRSLTKRTIEYLVRSCDPSSLRRALVLHDVTENLNSADCASHCGLANLGRQLGTAAWITHFAFLRRLKIRPSRVNLFW